MGMLSSCICSTLVSLCAMKGIPIGPLAQWGKDLTYYLSPSFCLVNWDTYYPSSACRGTDLPPGRILYIHKYVIRISRSLVWSKTLIELIFNPCGEFRWSPEGPVSQIHSPHLLVGAPRIFSDLLRFVQMLKRECGAKTNRTLPHLFIPSKTAT